MNLVFVSILGIIFHICKLKIPWTLFSNPLLCHSSRSACYAFPHFATKGVFLPFGFKKCLHLWLPSFCHFLLPNDGIYDYQKQPKYLRNEILHEQLFSLILQCITWKIIFIQNNSGLPFFHATHGGSVLYILWGNACLLNKNITLQSIWTM